MTDLGSWDALGPDEVATLFLGVAEPWWPAGGWAVELAVGRPFRSHADTDVLVLRTALPSVRESLAGDLDHLGPLLDDEQRRWLVDALTLLEPHHRWLRRLR